MAVLSGKYAEVLFNSCNMLEMESWDLEYGSNVEEFNARSGAGATKTVDGVHSGSGAVSGFFDNTDPMTTQVATGALVTLALRHTATGPIVATGSARIGKYSLGADRGGAPQPITIPFVTDGVWTLP